MLNATDRVVDDDEIRSKLRTPKFRAFSGAPRALRRIGCLAILEILAILVGLWEPFKRFASVFVPPVPGAGQGVAVHACVVLRWELRDALGEPRPLTKSNSGGRHAVG